MEMRTLTFLMLLSWLLILLPTSSRSPMDNSAFLFEVDARDITDTMPAPVDDRWQVVFPSLMIDWSIVAEEIRDRNF